MLYSHNKNGLYICCGRGLFENYFNDLWVYDFNDDQWREMDQTYISITPEHRFSPIGGIYPSYESNLNQTKSNLYLGMGSAQYQMFDNMYIYQFTDLRYLKGLWDRSKITVIYFKYFFYLLIQFMKSIGSLLIISILIIAGNIFVLSLH